MPLLPLHRRKGTTPQPFSFIQKKIRTSDNRAEDALVVSQGRNFGAKYVGIERESSKGAIMIK